MGFSLRRSVSRVTKPVRKVTRTAKRIASPVRKIGKVTRSTVRGGSGLFRGTFKNAGLNHLVSPIASQIGLSKKGANFVKSNFKLKGKLDIKNALGLGFISPIAASVVYPRESLIAAGVAGAGAYAAGAGAAAAAPVTAGSVATTAATGAAVTAVAEKTFLEKAGEFAVETAVMDKVAQRRKKSAESSGSYTDQAGTAAKPTVSSMSLKDIVNHPVVKLGFAAVTIFSIYRGMA